jgi:hypothetical protein
MLDQTLLGNEGCQEGGLDQDIPVAIGGCEKGRNLRKTTCVAHTAVDFAGRLEAIADAGAKTHRGARFGPVSRNAGQERKRTNRTLFALTVLDTAIVKEPKNSLWVLLQLQSHQLVCKTN